jgi:hypothetical protein
VKLKYKVLNGEILNRKFENYEFRDDKILKLINDLNETLSTTEY